MEDIVTKREKLTEKLELEGTEVSVLDIKQIESEIEEQIRSEKLGFRDETKYNKTVIRVLTNALNQFLEIVEKTDSITNLSKIF